MESLDNPLKGIIWPTVTPSTLKDPAPLTRVYKWVVSVLPLIYIYYIH